MDAYATHIFFIDSEKQIVILKHPQASILIDFFCWRFIIRVLSALSWSNTFPLILPEVIKERGSSKGTIRVHLQKNVFHCRKISVLEQSVICKRYKYKSNKNRFMR